MNITREQYEADIRAAKRAAWDEGWEAGTDDLDLHRGCCEYVTPNPYEEKP